MSNTSGSSMTLPCILGKRRCGGPQPSSSLQSGMSSSSSGLYERKCGLCIQSLLSCPRSLFGIPTYARFDRSHQNREYLGIALPGLMPRLGLARGSLDKGRGRQPTLLRIIGEQGTAIPDRVDDLAGDLLPHGRAAPATTESSQSSDGLLADVGGAMDDDGSAPGHVVDPLFQSPQAQRVAIAAEVSIGSHEQAKACSHAAGVVGKECGQVAAAAPSVGNELAEEKLSRDEIKHEKARFRRWQRVVDDGQNVGAFEESARIGGLRRLERKLENSRAQTGCLPNERRNQFVR